MIEQIAILPVSILFLIVISQYFIVWKPRRVYNREYFPSLSVLVPAHNEERYIENCVNSILESDYQGEREIVVINDGSTDRTGDILKKFSGNKAVRVLKTNHLGKSRALNKAISLSKNEVIAGIDGDTDVGKESLKHLVRPLQDSKVAAVGGIVKIRNKRKPVSWFQNIEYLYSSFFNSLCDKINGNIFTPGPISAFKRDRVEVLKGFRTDVFLEDVDMSLRIVRSGYRVRISERAVVRTNVPESVSGWVRQRRRWMKGGIEMIKNHKSIFFKRKYGTAGFYPFPIISYWYFHSMIMGIVLFTQIFGGYYMYFYLNGDVLSLGVAQYFLYWLSILGIINLGNLLITGAIPVTTLSILSIMVTAFAYPMYLYPFYKFRERPRVTDFIALFFMFPYWLLVLVVQISSNIHWLIPTERKNWWIK
jgi:cellulose synthase/poly-beta-1,6-N-acetylglucosamine synthase-like glycosyltransferase